MRLKAIKAASIDGRKVTDEKGNIYTMMGDIPLSVGGYAYTDGYMIYGHSSMRGFLLPVDYFVFDDDYTPGTPIEPPDVEEKMKIIIFSEYGGFKDFSHFELGGKKYPINMGKTVLQVPKNVPITFQSTVGNDLWEDELHWTHVGHISFSVYIGKYDNFDVYVGRYDENPNLKKIYNSPKIEGSNVSEQIDYIIKQSVIIVLKNDSSTMY